MKNFDKTRNSLTRLLDRWVIRLIGNKCEQCGSRNTEYSSYRWARGWNNWCEQAYGDAGCHCNKCHHITWDDSIEEHMAKLPSWCKPYNAD